MPVFKCSLGVISGRISPDGYVVDSVTTSLAGATAACSRSEIEIAKKWKGRNYSLAHGFSEPFRRGDSWRNRGRVRYSSVFLVGRSSSDPDCVYF